MKKVLYLLFISVLCLCLAGCGYIESLNDSGNSDVDVSGVSSSMDSVQYVRKNTWKQLSVNVIPTNADNQKIIWSTTDISMATVLGEGMLLSGSTPGSVTISATTEDGSYQSIFKIVIVNGDYTEQSLLVSDVAADDTLGYSVSISGDYAIVGSNCDDDNGSESGSAYVFNRDGTSWSQQAKLLASDGAANDLFGTSVCINGDYAIVGSYNDDGSGSAYVFKRDGTSWSQQAKLLSSDGAANDRFGLTVSISGDYAVVGATFHDDNGDNSGSAYVFKRDGTSWSQQSELLASDGAAGDSFGCSVSIIGDSIIVGSYYDDDNGINSGSAYVFKRDGISWSQQSKLLPSDGGLGDIFGTAVSISEDYAVVGSHRDGDNGSDSGSAYIFKRDGVSWSQQAKLLPTDGAAGDEFGISVSISGDYVIVSSPYDDDNGDNSGSAYVFKRDGTSWSQQTKLLSSAGAAADGLGRSVSISGGKVIIGSPFDDGIGSNSGSASMYFLSF